MDNIIRNAQHEVYRHWCLACRHIGVGPESRNACITEGNPHKRDYERAVSRLRELEDMGYTLNNSMVY